MKRLLAVVATLGLLSVAGCSDLGKSENGIDADSEGQIVVIAPDDRVSPVEASGPSIDGGELDLADYRGEIVVANVWWSGCGPCRQEMPLLVDITSDVANDAVLIGINTRESSAANAQSFMRGIGVEFPSFYDQGGEVLLAFGKQVRPQLVPSTAVLDREGRLAALVSGEITSPVTLRDVIADVAAEDG